jgi:XTP/dITP diphosphohydrolase
MEILLATNNNHKADELRKIFTEHKIILPHELGIKFSYNEDGNTYFENAFGKALALYKLSGKPVLSDDSGLSVISLNGAPGVYSARYGSKNNKRLNDSERNKLILKQMKNKENRKAFFVCCMVLLFTEYRFFISQETVSGTITDKPYGTNGFGYDPIFFVDELSKTAAELPGDQKNNVSHRGRASQNIISVLKNLKST